MAKNRYIIFLYITLYLASAGCTSRLLVSSKGCYTKAQWNTIEREFHTSLGDKFATKIKHQEKFFDHVFSERIWTPLGQFSREKLLLDDLLRFNGINCNQIKSVEITYYNDFIDIISSVIPLLSSRSVLLKVKTIKKL